MNIHEHQAKQILKKFGIPVPKGDFGFSAEEIVEKAKKLNLNQYVLKAYGWSEGDNILENLLNLNLEISTKEKKNQHVIGPWAPT